MSTNGNSIGVLVREELKEEYLKVKRKFFPVLTGDREADAFERRRPMTFKVEAEGDELVALASKSYCLTKWGQPPKLGRKGVGKRNNLTLWDYKSVLFDKRFVHVVNMNFLKRQDHPFKGLQLVEQGKIGLSDFYCKREVLADNVHTKPLML